MDRELPKDMTDIEKAIEKIFDKDQGGEIIKWLGEQLGRAVQRVNKTQVRKFLTELKKLGEEDKKFELNRFRWLCRYIVAQEKNLKLLGEYLDAAAKKAAETDTENRVERLQNLMESVYAHYCYNDAMREER